MGLLVVGGLLVIVLAVLGLSHALVRPSCSSVLLPLACLITNGMGMGVIVYVLLRAIGGRARTIPALLWLLAAAFGMYSLLQLG